jgi:hypothetical protein
VISGRYERTGRYDTPMPAIVIDAATATLFDDVLHGDAAACH